MVQSMEYYMNLSVEELAQEDYFIQNIKSPTAESVVFWQQLLSRFPDQDQKLSEAGLIVRSLKFQSATILADTKGKLWERIVAGSATIDTKVIPMRSNRRWIWAAAASALLIFSTVGYFLIKDSKERIKTQFAEVKQLVLPDQSIVTLNANSSIRYNKKWSANEPREVWLKGEAFFEVKHLNQEGQPIKDHERFIVHVGETEVEVLGTTFNASDRQTVTRIVLQSGKVRVDFKDKQTASVVMEPGEIVNYNQRSKRLVREKTSTEKYISWKEKEILLDSTSFEEIVAIIENTFGYKVVIEGKELLSRQLSATGKVLFEDERTFFRTLELLLDLTITRKDNTLFIRKK
jgi:transmembrane sensor